MKKLFSMDNPLMTALSTAADLLVLNLLTAVLSIPLITAGPAIAAMNGLVLKIVRKEECYMVKPFFRAFKENFRKGALLGLILIAAAGILYCDYLAAKAYIPQMRTPIAAMGILLLAVSFYAFALLARYENTLKATLKNAAALAVAYFPRTLFMVVSALGFWYVCIRFYRIGAPILILFGFSLPCYLNMLMIDGVFHRLDGDEPEENLQNTEDNNNAE